MKNIYLKSIIIILILIVTIFAFQNVTNATTVEEIIQSGKDFFEDGKDSPILDQTKIQPTIDIIYNVLFSICIVTALIVGIFIGIKFMTGSAEDQAKVKETLLPYTIGCIIAFGAFGIWKLVMTIINTLV